MRSPRPSAMRLPRYTRRKWLRSEKAWGYFFDLPSWARKDPSCPMDNEPLGTDYDEAVRRVEMILLPQLDSWRTGGLSDMAPSGCQIGTFGWMVAEFRADDRYRQKDAKTRSCYDQGLELAGNHVLKDGRKFRDVRLTSIDAGAADRLYAKLVTVSEPKFDDDGKPVLDDTGKPVMIERNRRSMANLAMRSCRRAWNICHRLHSKTVPKDNPFAKMGLQKTDTRETPTATYEEMQTFMRYCDDNGRSSLATAALIAWEWVQREEDIFGTLDARHYRPKERPDAVRIVHEKTRAEAWIPLFDPVSSAPLYPELMARMDRLKSDRIAGLMIIRDWTDSKAGVPLPWITARGRLDYMRHEVKRLILAAGLHKELSFTSFRHGGMTEAGEADLTDREIQALSRHKTVAVLPRYAKRTMKQVATVARKRRAARTNDDGLSE